MLRRINHFWNGNFARIFFAAGCLLWLSRGPVLADSVVLTWNPSPDANVAGYKIYYGTVSHTYTNSQDVGNTSSATISGLDSGTTYYFAATTYDSSGDESDFSNEASESTSGDAPIAPISDSGSDSTSTSDTNSLPAPPVSVPPTEITSVTNPVVPAPTSTPVTSTTSVTNPAPVISGNYPPTLNPIADMTVNENSGMQSILLSGITSGSSNEKQTLQVSAASSKSALIPKPTISYLSPQTNGTLRFRPTANATGTATITVTVNDGGKSNNVVLQTFNITVVAPTKTTTGATTTPAKTPTSPTVTSMASPNAPKISGQTIGGTTLAGKTVSFSVIATGRAPLKYQWKRNGANIPSATSPTLTLKNVSTSQAGLYSVSVSNASGSIDSPAVNLTVSPSTAATLICTNGNNGQFTFLVSGIPNYQYVVQASTNMTDWVSIKTNTSPFVMTDVNAYKYGQRFYRSFSLQ